MTRALDSHTNKHNDGGDKRQGSEIHVGDVCRDDVAPHFSKNDGLVNRVYQAQNDAARLSSNDYITTLDQTGKASTNLPREFTTTVQSHDGKQLYEQVRQREGDTNIYKMSEYEGTGKLRTLRRTEYQQNIEVGPDGKISYERVPTDLTDIMTELALGRSRLTAGDIGSAKEDFLNVAEKSGMFGGGENGRKQAENYVNMMINLHHKRLKDGFKAASDDQLAASLRSLASIYEKPREGTAKSFNMSQLNSRVESALKSLANPEKYNNQGQVGSCGLNTCLFIAEMLHPDKVAKTFAQITSTGQWRKHTFSVDDMSARSGRDSFNNLMTEALANTFGFNNIYRGFRGTCMETEGVHAYKALTGDKLPWGKKGLQKYGVGVAITMGGAHAQAYLSKMLNGKRVTDLENWWNGYGERTLNA